MKYTVSLILSIICIFCQSETIKIKNIGLQKNDFGVDNFEILRNTHIKAISENIGLDYTGIDTIRLLVPSQVSSIPIPNDIDFKNVVFIVKNNSKSFFLFKYSKDLIPITIDKKLIGKSNMINDEVFLNRSILLVIRDKNPWVKERFGYGFPHIRQDLLIVKNGRVLNSPIQSYGEYSDPEFFYTAEDGKTLNIRNYKLIRSGDSTYKTFCIYISNTDGICLENISVKTPQSNLHADEIISINNCANIKMSNVVIEGTYSQFDKYGYGISMNNVYNSTFKNVYCDGNWGVFGTNNVNLVHIDKCDLNRFDIHCYGKDVYCKNTIFRNLYNQFSSFYGVLKYDNCKFINFVPITIEGTYSAYTSFDAIFNDCQIQVDPNRPFLCNMTQSKFLISSVRPELSSIAWPNITLDNINIYSNTPLTYYYLFHTYKKEIVQLNNILNIILKNVRLCSGKLGLSNSRVNYDGIEYSNQNIQN